MSGFNIHGAVRRICGSYMLGNVEMYIDTSFTVKGYVIVEEMCRF